MAERAEVSISTPDDDAAPSTVTRPERAQRPRPARTTRPRPIPSVLLGRYEVIEELGQGGMGIVYRARDTQLGRDVAIKLVVTSNDPGDTLAARLLREAQALAQLSHPNVVAVYDVGRSDDGVFVAMELVHGVAGDEWLRTKRPWREAVRVFCDAARGLAAAHAGGLVHRDFKPANLIIGTDGRVRVLDFGLARTALVTAGSDDVSLEGEYDSGERERSIPSQHTPSLLEIDLTQAGALVGTPPYMAPEQHLGQGCDARSDQFSFCVSLYRALYGTRPFDGKLYSELKANIIGGHVKPPPADTDVPAWLRDVVLRGLAVDPARRWPSMDALIAALLADPAARRRKRALAALGVVALGGAGFALWLSRTDPADACRVDDRELAGAWDGARKGAIRAAFTATGKPFASDALAAVTRALDGYTTRWRTMRTDACLATRVRGTQSEDLLDLRIECLQRRLDDVRALVDVFATADGEVVSRAAAAASRIPPLDACADAEALRAPVRPPADPRVADQVEDAQRTLASVRALWGAGRYAAASTQLAPVVTQARALGYRPLEGEALLMQARLADDTGDYQGAAKLYKEAAIAAEAGRDDETAALARNGLVWVVGQRLGRYDEARELAIDAAAKVERLGHPELVQADLDQKVAALLLAQGDYEEAEARSRRVLATREKLLAPDDPAIALALGDIGDVLVQTTRYADAVGFYQRAVAVAERAVGPDHSLCGSLRTNLGTALRSLGKPADALAQYEKARSITERALGTDHPQLATLALDIGAAELDLGHLEAASAQFERARDVWTRVLGADHPNIGTTHYRLGEIALKQGRLAPAMASFQRALDIWQTKLGADHPSLAAALAGLGQAELAQHHPTEALGHYTRALAILEKALGPEHPELAGTLVDIGRCQLALGKRTRAVIVLERAVKILAKAGDADALAGARAELTRARAGGDRDR